eukprot:10970619-Heterocapsa_arctica.AAC.1
MPLAPPKPPPAAAKAQASVAGIARDGGQRASVHRAPWAENRTAAVQVLSGTRPLGNEADYDDDGDDDDDEEDGGPSRTPTPPP